MLVPTLGLLYQAVVLLDIVCNCTATRAYVEVVMLMTDDIAGVPTAGPMSLASLRIPKQLFHCWCFFQFHKTQERQAFWSHQLMLCLASFSQCVRRMSVVCCAITICVLDAITKSASWKQIMLSSIDEKSSVFWISGDKVAFQLVVWNSRFCVGKFHRQHRWQFQAHLRKKQNFLCHHEKWLKISGGQAQKQEIVFNLVWLPAVNLAVWTSSEEFLLDIQLNCAQFVDGVQLHVIVDNCTHLCAFACNSNFSGGKSAKILAKNSFGEQMHTFVCTCVHLLACVHKDFFAHVCWAIDLQILAIATTSFH